MIKKSQNNVNKVKNKNYIFMHEITCILCTVDDCNLLLNGKEKIHLKAGFVCCGSLKERNIEKQETEHKDRHGRGQTRQRSTRVTPPHSTEARPEKIRTN